MTVKDTGIGIPEDRQSSIFEAFKQQDGQSTREYGGTGLGLTITKRLVSILNGTIELQSAPGAGSTFTLSFKNMEYVPVTHENIVPHDHLNPVFEDQEILLVEDNVSNKALIEGYLESLALKLQHAENGKVALEKLEMHTPDLILMDLMMPVMDGLSAIKLIRANPRLKHIPIIALTASSFHKNSEEIKALCDDYLLKPINKLALLNALSEYLSHTHQDVNV